MILKKRTKCLNSSQFQMTLHENNS